MIVLSPQQGSQRNGTSECTAHGGSLSTDDTPGARTEQRQEAELQSTLMLVMSALSRQFSAEVGMHRPPNDSTSFEAADQPASAHSLNLYIAQQALYTRASNLQRPSSQPPP